AETAARGPCAISTPSCRSLPEGEVLAGKCPGCPAALLAANQTAPSSPRSGPKRGRAAGLRPGALRAGWRSYETALRGLPDEDVVPHHLVEELPARPVRSREPAQHRAALCFDEAREAVGDRKASFRRGYVGDREGPELVGGGARGCEEEVLEALAVRVGDGEVVGFFDPALRLVGGALHRVAEVLTLDPGGAAAHRASRRERAEELGVIGKALRELDDAAANLRREGEAGLRLSGRDDSLDLPPGHQRQRDGDQGAAERGVAAEQLVDVLGDADEEDR